MPDIDIHALRELVLFAENDGDLYRQSQEPIERNLLAKSRKGAYDHELSKRLWMLHVRRAFDRYEKENGKGSLGPIRDFPFSQAAKQIADNFADENNLERGKNPSVITIGKPVRTTYAAGAVKPGTPVNARGRQPQSIFKHASTVIPINRGQQEFGRIYGQNKIEVPSSGAVSTKDRDRVIRSLKVAQPKPSEKKFTLFVNGSTSPTGSSIRKDGLTLSEAKREAQRINKLLNKVTMSGNKATLNV